MKTILKLREKQNHSKVLEISLVHLGYRQYQLSSVKFNNTFLMTSRIRLKHFQVLNQYSKDTGKFTVKVNKPLAQFIQKFGLQIDRISVIAD